MNQPLKEHDMSNKEDKFTLSYEVEKDGVRKEVRARKVENGWIIRFNKEYEDKEGQWQYEEKEYISKEAPEALIEKVSDKVKDVDETTMLISNIDLML